MDSSPLGLCSASIRSQSRPDPAQISATSGLPEHTHIPARGRSARGQGVAEGGVGFYSKRHVMLPSGP